MRMKYLMITLLLSLAMPAISPEVGYQVDEGERREKGMKDAEFLEKYREALKNHASDLRERGRLSVFLSTIGDRNTAS